MEPTRRAPVYRGVRCCASSCLSPADRPFSIGESASCQKQTHAPQQTLGRAFPMVSFVWTPVECLFYKFYGINCRPKSSAKLLDRFFHRRRQVSPVVKYLTHCVFDGYYHLLDGNLAVSFQHGLATHFGAACARWRLASCVASHKYTRGDE